MLSWVALEEMLADATDKLISSGSLPASVLKLGLLDRLKQALATMGRPFSSVDFLDNRRVRNDLTHPKQNIVITGANTHKVFAYCEVICARLVAPLPFRVLT